MSTPHTPGPDHGQNPQNPQLPQNPQPPPAPHGPQAPGPSGPSAHPAPGAAYPAPPKAPTSDSAGPARPLTVGSAPRSLMRVGIAIVGVLALLLPVSALAYTGVGLSTLVREETTHDLPADLEALTVDAHSATVEVEARDDIDAPQVRHTYQGAETEVSGPDITADGATAAISMPRTQHSFRWWAPRVGMEDTLTIELPADQAQSMDVDVTTVFGFTALDGGFGSVRAESQAGAMRLDVDASTVDARTRTGVLDVSGAMTNLTMETTAGYIDGSRLEVEETVSARTTTGGIELGFRGATVPAQGIEAHARNGSVTVALPREGDLTEQEVTGYSVNASSSSGWTDVAVDQMPPGDGAVPVTVSSESGSVDVHYRDGSDGMSGADTDDDWNEDPDRSDRRDGDRRDGDDRDGDRGADREERGDAGRA